MSRYDNIVAELATRVPELADECQTEIVTFLEQCQRGQKEPLSEDDIAYLRALASAQIPTNAATKLMSRCRISFSRTICAHFSSNGCTIRRAIFDCV